MSVRVFVFEFITATCPPPEADAPSEMRSLYREGKAMQHAIVTDLAALPGVEVLLQPFRDASPEKIEQTFRQLASQADFTLVIAPEFEGILERYVRWATQAGSRVWNASVAAIRLTSDKLTLSEHWTQQGVPTPPTWTFGEEPADLFPRVVKLRDGAGSYLSARLDTLPQVFDYRQQVNAAGRSPNAFIAQPWLTGQAASVSFLLGPTQSVPLLAGTQRIAVPTLSYQGGRLPLAPCAARRAGAIARAALAAVPGLCGFVGVDVLLGDDGRDWAIEINPRLTTSYVGLRALAQFNLAEALWAVCQPDKALPPIAWKSASVAFSPDGNTSFMPTEPDPV